MRTENDRLRALAPISDEKVAALALDGERELARAIAERPRRRPFALLRGDGQGSRPPLAAVAASVALLALAGVGVAVGVGGMGGSAPAGGPAGAPVATERSGVEDALDQLPDRVTSTQPSTTLPATTVPNDGVELIERGPQAQAPRYLLPEGWKVTRVDEYVRDGEMTFERGRAALELAWGTGSFDAWFADRAHDADRLPDIEVDGGQKAAVFANSEDNGFLTALWKVGDFTLELRVPAVPSRSDRFEPWARLSATEFGDTLRALRLATLRDWLAAVPEKVIRLDERPQEVEAMLADVPLPPGFDTAPLMEGELVKDRYQLGATVIGAVSCAWIDRWAAARRAGDRAGVAEAAAAMARVTDAALMRVLEKGGAFPSVVKDFARAMARPDGRTFRGKGAVADEAAKEGLNCSAR